MAQPGIAASLKLTLAPVWADMGYPRLALVESRRLRGPTMTGPALRRIGTVSSAGALVNPGAEAGARGLQRSPTVVPTSQQTMSTVVKPEIIAEYKTHEKDTGSSEVQIALLTARLTPGVVPTSTGARLPPISRPWASRPPRRSSTTERSAMSSRATVSSAARSTPRSASPRASTPSPSPSAMPRAARAP